MPKGTLSETSLMVGAAHLLRLGERYYSNAQQLSLLGFKRQLVERSHKGFVTDIEFSNSLSIWHEAAKEQVASYGQTPMPLHGHVAGYKSPVLERLRVERAKLGFGLAWFQSGGDETWRYYLAPLDQSLERERQADSSLWKQNNLHFQSELGRAASNELDIVTSIVTNGPPEEIFETIRGDEESYHATHEKIRQVSIHLLQDRLKRLGFELSRGWSTKSRLFFKKAIHSDFILAFVFEFGTVSFNVSVRLSPANLNTYVYKNYQWNNHFEFRLVEGVRGLHRFLMFNTLQELVVGILAVTSAFEIEQTMVERVSQLMLDAN